jgi:hypothetical protein
MVIEDAMNTIEEKLGVNLSHWQYHGLKKVLAELVFAATLSTDVVREAQEIIAATGDKI